MSTKGDTHDGMIRLYRVRFDIQIDLPGAGRGMFASRSDIVDSHPAGGRRGYEIWLDNRSMSVIIENPEHGTLQRVSAWRLVQFTRYDEAMVQPEDRRGGMVNSLQMPKPGKVA